MGDSLMLAVGGYVFDVSASAYLYGPGLQDNLHSQPYPPPLSLPPLPLIQLITPSLPPSLRHTFSIDFSLRQPLPSLPVSSNLKQQLSCFAGKHFSSLPELVWQSHLISSARQAARLFRWQGRDEGVRCGRRVRRHGHASRRPAVGTFDRAA